MKLSKVFDSGAFSEDDTFLVNALAYFIVAGN